MSDGEVITGIVDDAQVVDAAQVIDGEVFPAWRRSASSTSTSTPDRRPARSRVSARGRAAASTAARGARGEEALDESEIANCIINCKWRRASAPSVCGGACTRARAQCVRA